jgi:galactokinase
MNYELQNRITDIFSERFGQKPVVVKSPARINLIGEHTDYNGGYVFPATIDKYIFAAVAPSGSAISNVFSVDYNENYVLNPDDLHKEESGSWKNYVAGVVYGLLEKGCKAGNFNMVIGGNIPLGAGLSSSAALENSIVFGLNHIFGLGLTNDEMMDISIAAEHNFAGVQCGVMDQFANLNGKKDNAVLLDCATMSFNHIPVQLDDYQLVLVNSNVKHILSDSPYNRRKQECNAGFGALKRKYPALLSLSRATMEQLDSVRGEITEVVYKRCKFVIEENRRVLSAKEALSGFDVLSFGSLLYQSHRGLSSLYQVSCDELDFLVDFAKDFNGVAGSRMMGGGFGGCTLNLVKNDKVESFSGKVTGTYFKEFGIKADVYRVKITDGTEIVSGG